MHQLDFLYEEYFPPSGKTGTLYFDNINATLTNITNINSHRKPGLRATLAGTTLFMHKTPMRVNFNFDIAKSNTDEFTVDLHLALMEGSLINPVTEALALFSIRSGIVHDLTAHITGDNYHAGCSLTMLYDDLHISALKKDKQEHGNLKKRAIPGFIDNTFFIKNSNPNKKGDPTSPVVSVDRGHRGSFLISFGGP